MIASLCLPTAGDAAVAATASTRLNAVVEQRLVVADAGAAPGTPTITEAQAIKLAASYLGTSGQPTSTQAGFVLLTVRGDKGEVAWGIQARPVWLVTFYGVAYPPASTSSDCSCLAFYWRPTTVVALDAETGAHVINLGVAG